MTTAGLTTTTITDGTHTITDGITTGTHITDHTGHTTITIGTTHIGAGTATIHIIRIIHIIHTTRIILMIRITQIHTEASTTVITEPFIMVMEQRLPTETSTTHNVQALHQEARHQAATATMRQPTL